jgi:hypothetical protein
MVNDAMPSAVRILPSASFFYFYALRLNINMAIATEVARVMGARLNRGYESYQHLHARKPIELPTEGLLYEVSVALQWIIDDMPNFRKYIETEKAKIQNQLKKYKK